MIDTRVIEKFIRVLINNYTDCFYIKNVFHIIALTRQFTLLHTTSVAKC
jgi:hypothetical protein